MQAADVQRVCNLLPCFTAVPNTEWSLAEIRTVTPYTPHSIQAGHVLQHAMFVLSGSVRIHRISEQGREVTLYRLQAGQSCSLMMASLLGDTPYEASVSIEVDIDVLLIPVAAFKAWMGLYSSINRFVFQQIIERITSVTDLLENIAFRSVPYRVADFLLKQSSDSDGTLSITHEQLAVELGTAREVISRTLKEFRKQHMIQSHRGCLQITDRDRLLRLMHHSPS